MRGEKFVTLMSLNQMRLNVLLWMSGTKIAIGFVAFENVKDRNQQTMCDCNNVLDAAQVEPKQEELFQQGTAHQAWRSTPCLWTTQSLARRLGSDYEDQRFPGTQASGIS
jgi:hypothetical protein